jgi:crotonobetainyl-CoA:carnitine CoA-transferase CaiB-like acyl-CoA transferase
MAIQEEMAQQPILIPGLPPVQQAADRNKRSLSLDLGRPEGGGIFLKLAAQADIVVENFNDRDDGQMGRWL